MKLTTHGLLAALLSLCLSAVVGAQAPVPIREQTPGLLTQAKIAPASARLAAFAEFPGAKIVSAAIERRDSRLVYVFDLKHSDHFGNEHVEIDAMSGEAVNIEYCVQVDRDGNVVLKAAPEIVAQARIRFVAARDTALARAGGGHILSSRLRVLPSPALFLFDVAVGGEPTVTERVAILASTGSVVPP